MYPLHLFLCFSLGLSRPSVAMSPCLLLCCAPSFLSPAVGWVRDGGVPRSWGNIRQLHVECWVLSWAKAVP